MSFTVRSAHPLAHSLRSHARPHALRRARGLCGVAIAPISARSLWSHAWTLARLPPRSLNKDGLNKEGGEEKIDNIRRIIRLALFALAPNCFRRVALLFALLILSLRSHGWCHARSRSTSSYASTSLVVRFAHSARTLAMLVRSLSPTLPLVARALKRCRWRSDFKTYMDLSYHSY